MAEQTSVAVMAYTSMAYVVMAYVEGMTEQTSVVVMAYICYGLCYRHDICCSYGVYRYGLCCSFGRDIRYSYGLYMVRPMLQTWPSRHPLLLAYIIAAYIGMVVENMAYIGMADVVALAEQTSVVVMAYIVMAYVVALAQTSVIVTTYICYGLCYSYGRVDIRCSYGLYEYGLCSYGLC